MKKKITHGQLFGGIFGFGLAAQWAGIENVWYNDSDHFCCEKVRARMRDGQIYDKVKIYEQDIREIGKHNLQPVDLISAGVPCQPASVAGKRKGQEDHRWLWPETIRVTKELLPTCIFFENPDGIRTLGHGKPFANILTELEDLGYWNSTLQGKRIITPVCIPACSIGAWHKRNRIFIIAHLDNSRNTQAGIVSSKEYMRGLDQGQEPNTSSPINRQNSHTGVQKWQLETSNKLESSSDLEGERDGGLSVQQRTKRKESAYINRSNKITPDINSKGLQGQREEHELRKIEQERQISGGAWWAVEPGVVRMVHGVPNRMDRIKALGNSVPPQMAYVFFRSILQMLNYK